MSEEFVGDTNAEANDRAVLISEEVEFLSGLGTLLEEAFADDPRVGDIHTAIQDRIEVLDAAIVTVHDSDRAGAEDRAEEGIEVPEADADEGISDTYDAEDDPGDLTEDDLAEDVE